MKALLQQLTAYNLWAHQKIITCMLLQDENIWHQQTPSSFDSLYKTVVHLWDAETVWWQRVKLQERIIVPSKNSTASFTEVCNSLLQQSTAWEQWVKAATELALQHVFLYTNSQKEQFKQPVYEVIMHVCNHSTFHRGQLVTMLRQLGVTTLPQTDFSYWCRGQK